MANAAILVSRKGSYEPDVDQANDLFQDAGPVAKVDSVDGERKGGLPVQEQDQFIMTRNGFSIDWLLFRLL